MNNKLFAVTGMDCRIAGMGNLDRLDALIYRGETGLVSSPVSGAEGYAPADGAARFPRNTSNAVLLNDLLTSACRCAAIDSTDLELILIVEDKLDDVTLTGLQKSVSSLEQVASLADALQCAHARMLATPQSRIALLALHRQLPAAAVGQAGATNTHHTLAYDQNWTGYGCSEGAALVLLEHSDIALREARKCYGFIHGFARHPQSDQACRSALQNAQLRPDQVQYVDTTASADAHLRTLEQEALQSVYAHMEPLSCALGGVRSVLGDAGALSELMSLIKALLCAYQRYLPGIANWHAPRAADSWQHTPFYFPEQSRPWYVLPAAPRHAACHVQRAEAACHILLSDNPADNARPNGYFSQVAMHFFALTDASQAGLEQALDRLQQDIDRIAAQAAGDETEALRALARHYHQQRLTQADAGYCLVVLGESVADLGKEIQLLGRGLTQSLRSGAEIKTPKGSYFTPRPLGQEGGVTFVYPGVGAAYVGLGRDLFHLFPALYDASATVIHDMGATLKDTLINPRAQHALTYKDLKDLDLSLRHNLASISECGVGFACVFSKLFQREFGLTPDYALGYSMGEISMFAALDCWQDPGVLPQRMAESVTFNHNLTGELHTLRKHWGLPPATAGAQEKLWETYTLKGTVEQVEAACEEGDRVYVTIINTPDSLVIGGYPADCERVIARLGVRALAMEIPSAIHSPPAFMEYENIESLHTLDVGPRIATRLYSASCYLPVPQRTKAIANSIAKCFCEQVDFPRLLNTAYDNGARLFLEMGPGRSLCSWIDKILSHEGAPQPHAAIPVNAKGSADEVMLVRALARLVSHRVAVDIDCLFTGSLIVDQLPDSATGKLAPAFGKTIGV
ncbi:MAG: PfaB family protein [Chromatocurvus sp.]